MRRHLASAAVALLSCAAVTAAAQGPAKPPKPGMAPGGKPVNIWYVLPDPTPGDPFVPVLKTLKLGGKQVPRMRPWILKYNGQRAAAMKSKPEERKKKVQETNDALYWIIDGVLTPEQKPAFLAGLKKKGYTPPAHK